MKRQGVLLTRNLNQEKQLKNLIILLNYEN